MVLLNTRIARRMGQQTTRHRLQPVLRASGLPFLFSGASSAAARFSGGGTMSLKQPKAGVKSPVPVHSDYLAEEWLHVVIPSVAYRPHAGERSRRPWSGRTVGFAPWKATTPEGDNEAFTDQAERLQQIALAHSFEYDDM
jgi:hypothetical protein